MLCLATFVIASGPQGGAGRQVLENLIKLGAPCIYWPHDDDEPDAEPALTALVRRLNKLTDMPEAFLQKRIAEAGESPRPYPCCGTNRHSDHKGDDDGTGLEDFFW